MSPYDPHLHHRRSIRLKGYAYTQPGAYFVTLVTWQRDCLFGEIIGGVMHLNLIGKIIQSEWQRLTYHFHKIRLDAFIVMPNHFHGTIVIDLVEATRQPPYETLDSNPVGATRQPPAETPDGNSPVSDQSSDSPDGSPLPAPPMGPMPNSLGAMIGQFKSRATKRIWSLPGMDHSPVWQRNYYDHIVRDDLEYDRINQYIETNPLNWQDDQLHPSVINKGASLAPQQINQE